MYKSRATPTSVGGRAVGPIGFGMLGTQLLRYLSYSTVLKCETSKVSSARESLINNGCSRPDESKGRDRLSHRSQSPEDGVRAGSKPLERCKRSVGTNNSIAMSLHFGLQA